MKKIALAALCAFVGVSGAQAATTVIAIKDIGTTGSNTGQTFTGTGFVGEYSSNYFVNLFGLEGDNSKTNAQVDISSFLGKTITSATLSYYIAQNYNQSGVVTITGSAGTGSLGYLLNAPTATYGTALGTTFANNTADLTQMLTAAAAGTSNWLDLFFQDSVYSNWTYTSGDTDAAQLRLTVNYADAPAAVPEPASWAMMVGGFGLLGGALRRRKAAVSFA